MTEFIARRTGKLLFPNLPPYLRKLHVSRLMLIFWTVLLGNAGFVLWITHVGR